MASAALKGDFKLAQHAISHWHVVSKYSFDEVLKPEFWTHVGESLRPFDEITVVAEDGTWYARLMVIEAERRFARVVQLMHKKLEVAEPAEKNVTGYRIEWAGPQAKYRVIRESDSQELQRGFADKTSARSWLSGHLGKVAA